MKTTAASITALSTVLLVAGCATVPIGPSVMAFPGSGKSFDEFRRDDADCRQYAQSQTGGTDANQAAIDSGVRSAALGTAIGALAGAAIGGHQGAGFGAGAGLLMGSAAGSNAAQMSSYGTQRMYDHAYMQCMYAKGEQVPVPGGVQRPRYRSSGYQPAAPMPPAESNTYYPPPPPPGYSAP